MRILLERDPLLVSGDYCFEKSPWPAQWIGCGGHDRSQPVVLAFRLAFDVSQAVTVRLHVTADQRYDLYLDGERLGWGSERGDHGNWFYESYEEPLAAGRHVLVARVWWTGRGKLAHYGHSTDEPGFLLLSEGAGSPELSTGAAGWEVKRLGGYVFEPCQLRECFAAVGARLRVKGAQFDWGFEAGDGAGWERPVILENAGLKQQHNEHAQRWVLRHGVLPAMFEETICAGVVRHIARVEDLDTAARPVSAAEHQLEEAAAWDKMLRGGGPVTIPPHAKRRVIIDLENYYCAFPQVELSGGAGAVLRLHWAESLFCQPTGFDKGNRDLVEGKYFRGMGDSFEADGGAQRKFETLWWSAGRYLEAVVATADEALSIDALRLRQTHYPHKFESAFASSDGRLAQVTGPALRTLEMCSHESYMDCPYYEQLMYVGDTRLEVLTTYATTRDDRLPRKALMLFDESRGPGGLTSARYPTRVTQVIAPFSLWWVAMVHDYAQWRDGGAFVAARLPGVRAVLEAYRRCLNDEGLVAGPPGWNFMDWVRQWPHGIPPDGHAGVNASINLQAALVFRLAAELEEQAGEVLLAERNRQTAARIAAAAAARFWDEPRGLFAEDSGHGHFSEHAQCLALLGGSVPEGRRDRLVEGLLTAPDLARTTIYFTHYLFEALRVAGKMDRFSARMGLWFDLGARGLKTTVEAPEPTRSDAHAWAAHPVFHYLASVLGIRPGAPGFARVNVQPQLGSLTWARGAMVHPKGMIRVDLRVEGGRLRGTVELPAGVPGTLMTGAATRELQPGSNAV
jgi:hypothetical protein